MPSRNLIRFAAFAALTVGSVPVFADDPPPDAKSTASSEPTPADKTAERVFRGLDKNDDEKLSADEVTEEQRPWFQRQVRNGDQDKDGELTLAEFLAALKAEPRRPAPGDDRPNRPDGRPQADPAQRFARLDRNSDGKLTLDELPEPVRERMKPLFDRLGKTELSRDEFVTATGRPNPGADMQRNVEQYLKGLDRNGDGKLTLDEVPDLMKPRLQEWLEKAGKKKDEGLTLDELRKFAVPMPPGAAARPGFGAGAGPLFLRKLDVNRDGKLSKDEWQNAGRIFDELDADKDGGLGPLELYGSPPGTSGERPARPPEAEAASASPKVPATDPAKGPPGKGKLQRIDANGDGKVSRDEAQGKLRKSFGKFDANDDGYLEREELRKALQQIKAGKGRGPLKA